MKPSRTLGPILLGLTITITLLFLLHFAAAFEPILRETPLDIAGNVHELNRDESGSLWLSDYGAGLVRQVDPFTRVYTEYTGMSGASDAKTDANGDLWWTDFDNNRLGRLTPGTNLATTWPLTGTQSAWGLAVDPAGPIWVIDFWEPNLYRFDPAAKELCIYTIPNQGAGEYVLVQDGLVWFGDWKNNRLLRFNPSATTFTTWQLANEASPEGLVFDDQDRLWYADSGRQELGRLDPATGQLTTYAVPAAAGQAVSKRTNSRKDAGRASRAFITGPTMVAYHDGAVWFSDEYYGRFGRLLPDQAGGSSSSPKMTGDIPAPASCRENVPGKAYSIPVKSGEVNWSGGSYSTPVSGQGWTVYQLPADHYPWGIAVEEGQVWLAEQDSQKLGWLSFDPCYILVPDHQGSGLDPLFDPANSAGCQLGMFAAGQTITLTASPAPGWDVAGWQGTDDDASDELQNTVTMPAADHAVAALYYRWRINLPIVVKK